MTKVGTNTFRVMVIDDDEINNFLCSRVIMNSGIASGVDTYLTANEALDSISDSIGSPELLPTLILVDINMPIMSGWDFLERFSELTSKVNKAIRVAILSSSVYQKDKEKAESIPGVIGYVSKPLTAENFKELVERTR